MKKIKLNHHEIKILGTPNFQCVGAARILIDGGLYEKGAQKAEYEQAVYIHWAMNLYFEYGESWGEQGAIIIKDLAAKMRNELSKGDL